jgi:hypothetical protein
MVDGLEMSPGPVHDSTPLFETGQPVALPVIPAVSVNNVAKHYNSSWNILQ